MAGRRARRIGLLLGNGEPWVRTALAVWRLGATVVPLPLPVAFAGPDAYAGHIARIVEHGELDAVALDGSLGKHLHARVAADLGATPLVDVAEQPAGPATGLPAAPGGNAAYAYEDTAVIQYTSGSTANPKGVVLSHANVAAGLETIAAAIGWTAQDQLGLWLPLFHDMGLFSLMTALAQGTAVHLWQPSDAIRRPLRWLREFGESGATLCPAPNFFYEHLTAAAERQGVPEGVELSRWRAATNGAELVHERTVERFERVFAPYGLRPGTCRPTYGMAEATLMVTLAPPGAPRRVLHVERDSLGPDSRAVVATSAGPENRPVVSCGRPAGSCLVRIGSENGTPLPDGVVGEVQIAGPLVTSGYLGLPADEQPFTPDGWLRTGDLAFVSEGELFITGRAKAMISVKGVNHYAEDVETVVRETPGVDGRRCAAFAWHDDTDDSEYLVVLWETARGATEESGATTEAIRRRLREQLGLAAVEVCPVAPATIPFTSSGKVKRAHARRLWPELSHLVPSAAGAAASRSAGDTT